MGSQRIELRPMTVGGHCIEQPLLVWQQRRQLPCGRVARKDPAGLVFRIGLLDGQHPSRRQVNQGCPYIPDNDAAEHHYAQLSGPDLVRRDWNYTVRHARTLAETNHYEKYVITLSWNRSVPSIDGARTPAHPVMPPPESSEPRS